MQDLMVGSSGQKYSAGYVQLLKQIGRDDKLTYEMKKKLFNTAFSLATAPGMVSHQHSLLLFTGIQDHIQFSGGGPTMADILKSLHKNLEQSEIPPQYQIDFPTDTNGEMLWLPGGRFYFTNHNQWFQGEEGGGKTESPEYSYNDQASGDAPVAADEAEENEDDDNSDRNMSLLKKELPTTNIDDNYKVPKNFDSERWISYSNV